ncbi:type II toxin-antitoxin system RelE/ParE family toxin [Dyadobacter sediminis]|uniref:Type II toxin-antitoxin system RelE/ParE family toxin n=1 Tax=Dyadobacter sediminis TaxID=1493691 RepID=A0A5R9K9A5_9BACT|nr:type II toxin-antitoxin system RelE/ParE family toxin [Dyadobacter sediminis]TLU90679.1 type II toxin-antitoxin system RelE/ParE family toxin [Dyadobacter sediminis]GGC09856.1 hypothetical protein GCM10011325_40900 [Dyadobacter sediminis]
MSLYKIEVLKIAEVELSEAYNWYEKQQKGLGNRLINEVSKYMNSMAENPFKYPSRYNNELYFAPLKIFPFLIAYWVDNQKSTVFVVSIFHTSRNPAKFTGEEE